MPDTVGDERRKELIQRHVVFCCSLLCLFHHMVGKPQRICAHDGWSLLLNSATKGPALMIEMPITGDDGPRRGSEVTFDVKVVLGIVQEQPETKPRRDQFGALEYRIEDNIDLFVRDPRVSVAHQDDNRFALGFQLFQRGTGDRLALRARRLGLMMRMSCPPPSAAVSSRL